MSSERPQSHVTGTIKPTGGLAFSTPMGVSIVVVLAIAIIAAAFLFGPRGLFSLGSDSSPSQGPATPTSIASVDPTATPEGTPSVTPAATPTPTATPQPAATPVPMWTGLDWSEPMLRTEDEPWLMVLDSVRWGDGYAGVGSIDPASGAGVEPGAVIPVFLWSDDGRNWDVVQELPAEEPSTKMPSYVVASNERLLAMAGRIGSSEDAVVAPRLWRSEDGHSWTLSESPSWAGGWSEEALGNYLAAAGGPSGFVVIGAQPLGGCCVHPVGTRIIGQSPDGQTWTWLADAPAFAGASFSDIQATPDGFVVAGRVGAPMAMMDSVPLGRAAAWFSPDGVTWTAADVEGAAEVVGGQISQVLVGARGLFAIGVVTPDTSWWERTSAWASADGRDWRLVDGLASGMLSAPNGMSDGVRMVILGRDALTATTTAGWTSSDGVTWSRLEIAGSPPVAPFDGYHSPAADEALAHDPAYFGSPAQLWSWNCRLQDGEVIGYGWVATTSDPHGDGTVAKWIASAVGD